MRHNIAGNNLSRNTSLRKATLRDLAKATLIKQRICTTQAKAKEARKLVEKLITLGKKGTLADKRRAFAILCDHSLVSDLFNKTSPRFKNRIGGYTRIITLGLRRGDNAQMVYLELTEKEEIIVSKPKTAKAQDKKAAQAPASAVEDAVVEKPEAKEIVKETKKDPSRDTHRKPIPTKETKPKNLMGNIRQMFNRKVGGE